MVSIHCITYNHEPYIRQCLEGFVMQKTNFRFEAIVHDDASTDRTADIIREYAAKYPNIIKPIYETENQYSKRDGSLRRIMDAACTGKYIALCEGDDYWIDPLKLQKQVDFLEANPEYSMCFHNAVIFYQDDKKTPKIFNNIVCECDINLEQLINKWIVPTASIIYRKDILPIPEWANQIYSGDMTLALVAYAKGKIRAFPAIMSFYRKNVGSMSSKYRGIDGYVFVRSQHTLLYELFDKWTDGRYHNILMKRIDSLREEVRFFSLRKKSLILALFCMPFFSIKRILFCPLLGGIFKPIGWVSYRLFKIFH